MTEHVLDNPVWSSLGTTHAHFAVNDGVVVHYPDDVSPFGAVERLDTTTRAAFAELRRTAWILRRDLADDATEPLAGPTLRAHQMVAPAVDPDDLRIRLPEGPFELRVLDGSHVDAMLDLTQRTRPGPFLRGTVRFGGYLGVFVDDALVAMAGRRMQPAGWCEVSAVCSDPDHQGRGLAAMLTLRVAAAVQAEGNDAFLHVAANNDRAIALYEHLGFRRRATLGATVVGPPAH